ncbi:BatA domain-containing protein [Tenacibaculum amylolyticum]|uniref:BatA domain-containing protein n=1 Tax=Tenacibaculum amylolyticum TaxID=104269 RepID=UPI0038944084
MQFKHPEFLYFLSLLIIPILVHLFQLRKFKKVPFTNVAFLQKLVIKNRKSSQLKKWLILSTRLLLFAAIIFAFAQPYFSNTTTQEKQHTFLYLDNSLSTNTKGNSGNLLKTAAQELIENSTDGTYSLLTNNNFYSNITVNELKTALKKVKNTSKNIAPNEVFLKIANLKNTTENVIISDFQNLDSKDFASKKIPLSLVQLTPEKKNNLSVDSVFVNQNATNALMINVVVKNQGTAKENVPIAIYNGDKLISKQTISIDENSTKNNTFTIEKTNPFLGRIQITYNDTYSFDNTFYFSLNSDEKINVLAIGANNDFLSRIYTENEFNFTSSELQKTNYNIIDQQQLIILNELERIPQSLITSLVSFTKNGGHLIIIPNKESDIPSYNTFLTNLSAGKIEAQKKDSLKITSINFNHPLLKDVFDKKVRNFQYPYVNTSFTSNFSNASKIIGFENNQRFITQVQLPNSKLYWFASPLNKTAGNFTNSPLIVPVFYNIGQQSLQLSQLYYFIDQSNTIEVNTQLDKDDILTITGNNSSFIPLQQTFQNKVSLHTKELPDNAGFYTVKKEETPLVTIAFNFPKNESLLEFMSAQELSKSNENIKASNSVRETVKKINDKTKVHWLWKWFLALAIVSLLLEILILKYFKV